MTSSPSRLVLCHYIPSYVATSQTGNQSKLVTTLSLHHRLLHSVLYQCQHVTNCSMLCHDNVTDCFLLCYDSFTDCSLLCHECH
ncbi:hypothetical protein NP493_483g01011 [Ridgeia piscesae]|uniref:Uncharacterized protein n=1 Tax=Ridgeia piscesae TaxID=27915 RepID=A0AAD9IYR6_RIDPI|nr:hypothetical protein NP493_4531g00000 [Ridgeia piscesae]KAK2179554.1 hypothetical protein NP493_483g01011 [Ridgeia piscesae]